MINLEAGPPLPPPLIVEINPVVFVGGSQAQKADGVNQALDFVQSTDVFNQGDVVAVHNLNGQVFIGTISGVKTSAGLIFDHPITIDVQPGAAIVKISQVQIVDQWIPLVVIPDLSNAANIPFNTPQVPSTAKFLGIAIGQLIPNGGGQTLLTNLNIRGNQTGTLYTLNNFLGFSETGFVTVPINGVADSTYRITWSNGSSVGKAFIYSSTLSNGFPSLGQAPSGQSIPVVTAPDQIALLNPSAIAAKLQSGAGTSVVIPSVGGKTIRVFSVELVVRSVAAGGSAQLIDSGGGAIAEVRTDALNHISVNFGGAPITTSAELDLLVNGAGAVVTYVSYNQI